MNVVMDHVFFNIKEFLDTLNDHKLFKEDPNIINIDNSDHLFWLVCRLFSEVVSTAEFIITE